MKFIRQQQKKNVQFSKSEIDFLNNFNNFEQFASFSNAFKNLYNKILNFAEEEKVGEVKAENKGMELAKDANNLASNVRRSRRTGYEEGEKEKEKEFLEKNEDLLDPKYWSEYASMRADSDLGKKSGSGLVAKYVDRFGPQLADYAKRSISNGSFLSQELPLQVRDRIANIRTSNTELTARNAAMKHSVAGAENPTPAQIARQIERTRENLFLTKQLPTPENVMDTVRLGADNIDWSNPNEVKQYEDILRFYENIEKNAPEDLKALSWNNNQRGNTAYA